MPIVQAKCTNCGSVLEVDVANNTAICTYCETPYIVEKAIQNYNNSLNIANANIYVQTEPQSDFVIHDGILDKYVGYNLEHIVIPNNVVKIGNSAFADSMIYSVELPNGLISIGELAFAGCINLKSIKIPNSVTDIERAAFAECRLTSIVIPSSVRRIHPFAFSMSRIQTLTIEDGVQTIGEDAFRSCHLSSVSIPSSVTSIGTKAFAGTELVDVQLHCNLSENDIDSAFAYTPWHSQRSKTLLTEKFKRNGNCQYCGGTFTGLFTKKCSKCGKPKDY